MHLYLAEKIRALGTDARSFFRLAHIWRFGKDTTGVLDAQEYVKQGIIPPYVREYIYHIQHKERDHAM